MDKTRPEEVRTSPARLAKAPRRVGGSTGGFSKAWALALALGSLSIGTAVAGTPPGTVITNTASLTFTAPGGSTATQQTNTVKTTVVSVSRTPSSVIFMDYEPGFSGSANVVQSSVNTGSGNLLAGPTECSVDGGTTFSPLPNAPNDLGTVLNTSKALPLVQTSIYEQDEVVFVRLIDLDQNLDPTVRDTVLVTVSVPSTRQSVVLRLTETGVNTGVFAGYVPTSSTANSGCTLKAGANTQLQVNYTDISDSSDKSSATALVDPFDVVFDSTSGKRLDGAKLTLVDAETGEPVKVLGKDGVSIYPSTLTSGSEVTDSAGVRYPMPAGGFLFPVVKSGNYRVEVVPPAGYHAPSIVSVKSLQGLNGAPYILPTASFGGAIDHSKLGILQLDMPLDPVSTKLMVQKTVSQPEAAIGDIIQFSITAVNSSTTLAAEGVGIVDFMPTGMRYVKGSARLGNAVLADPVISPTGAQLTFNVGTLLKTSSVTITYAVELTAATPLTTVVNQAEAVENGLPVSNMATAGVEVTSDFLQNVNTLIGRVVVGCDAQGKQGVEKARVVMEDGSYAVTDKNGDYHFQAIGNGTHVVQLDLPSLPKGYEPMSCVQNTRWAGRDYSQFVEVHGGALWRADFHVRPIPGAEGDLSLQLAQAPAQDHVHNTVQLAVSDVPVSNLSTTVLLPAGMTYMKGTARLDGQPLVDPQDSGDGMLVFRLDARAAGWKGVLEFDSMMPALQPAAPATHQEKSFIIEGFPSGKVELNEHDRQVMQQIADLIKSSANISMTFVGYTDDVPVAAGSQYANNIELSIGRAQAVADYLQAHIATDGTQIFISGRGENDPLASNDSEDGRAKNRRTEIEVQFDEKVDAALAANTVFQTRALANFDSPSVKSQHTPTAAVMLHALPAGDAREKDFTLQDFASGSTSLSDRDQAALQQVADLIKSSSHVSLTFVGYADNQQIAAGSKYANNMELSVARAQAAADFARAHMDMDGAQVFIVGRGDSTAADGDAQAGSRSTVIKVNYQEVDAAALAADANQSDVKHAEVKGLSPADETDARQQNAADAADDAAPTEDKLTDTFAVDPKWLETQADGTPQILWPTSDELPALPVIRVSVEHGPNQKVKLFINGEAVSGRDFLTEQFNDKHTAFVSNWMGVPLREGDNQLVAQVMDGDTIVTRLERNVHYSGVPVRAEFVADKSTLVADGRSKPMFAMRLLDRWGYPARRGLVGKYQVGLPFTAWQSVDQLQQDQTSAIAPSEPSYTIGEGGIAYLRLAPTTATGQITVMVPLPQDTQQQLHGWMRPADRDWILVGVASGTAAFDKIKNNMQTLQGDDPNSDIYQDGRVAYYAKGTIQGGFLVTSSYDSAKAGGVLTNGLQQAVNPNTYFMLYGDSSQEGFDASSSQKLYVKIERGQFYAMFGDYDTGLTINDLSHYDRMFTGVKSAYQGDHFGYTAFAAQNDQAYVQDEIQGNGTSGLYHLSHTQLLINSERVSIQVRDRYTNAVLSTTQLTPFMDYTIDYFGGTIFFKQPVPPNDPSFNPEYIVVQYEVSTGASNALTAGGRASVKNSSGTVELGVTGVNEGTGDGNNKLAGADLTVQVTPSTQLKAEVAHTDNGPGGDFSTVSNVGGTSVTTGGTNTNNATGNAYSVDLKTTSLALENDMYVKNEAPTFGLGQQSLGDAGMRRIGDDTRYNLDQSWAIVGQVQDQQSIAYDVDTQVVNSGVQYKFKDGDTLGAGLQRAQDSYPVLTPTVLGGTAQGDYATNQATVNGSYGMLDRTVILHGNVQTSVSGEAEDPQYPNMATAGVDYKVSKKATLFVDEQVASGAQQSDHSTDFGVKSQPWDHGEVDTSIGQDNTEYGPRLFSTMGLTQGWDLNKNWSLSAGYNRVATIHQTDFPVPASTGTTVGATTGTTVGTTSAAPAPAVAPAVGTLSSDFNALFVGAAYHTDNWSANGRFETLNSDEESTRNLFAGFYRALSQGQALSASLQAFHSFYTIGGTSDSVDGRMGYAWRPDESRWSWLQQLDLIYANQQGLDTLPQFATSTGVAASQESASTLANNPQTVATYGLDMRNWKIVDNLQGNYTVEDKYQISMYYGAKLARFAFDTGNYQGYTDIIGSEFRYDLKPKWDVGFLVSRIHSWSSGTVNGSYGIETGWEVGTNAWVSLGYNFSGYYDPDFTANHYTAKGVFLRFRFKFDQDTVKDWASGASKVALPPAP
ncbi:MAG TPA: OmpA family protein [Gammaproteobacteria bacterium]